MIHSLEAIGGTLSEIETLHSQPYRARIGVLSPVTNGKWHRRGTAMALLWHCNPSGAAPVPLGLRSTGS